MSRLVFTCLKLLQELVFVNVYNKSMTISDTLHFVITGGTIDSYFDPITGDVLPSKETYIPDFIALFKLYEKCKFSEICMKDSRDLKEADRRKVLNAVKTSNSKRIIVTHGSYTVSNTAKYIKKLLGDTDKVIIFVCSMIPLKGFDPNDAGFNLGYAVAKSQDLESGIYVCMNGRIFWADEVKKILSEGRFGSIYTK